MAVKKGNNISQAVIYEKAGDLAMKLPALILPKISADKGGVGLPANYFTTQS